MSGIFSANLHPISLYIPSIFTDKKKKVTVLHLQSQIIFLGFILVAHNQTLKIPWHENFTFPCLSSYGETLPPLLFFARPEYLARQ